MHSSAFLSSPVGGLFAFIILNVDSSSQHSAAASRFNRLWWQSSVRVCADGAANRLHDSLDEESRVYMLPDLIIGDLDSIRPDVASYYEQHGVMIQKESEQDSHDFEKCLRWLKQKQMERSGLHEDGYLMSGGDGGSGSSSHGSDTSFDSASTDAFSVVAYGAFGGRVDHLMANLNMAYAYPCFERFYLMSDESMATLLPPGSHHIEFNRDAEDGSCGLIPLGRRCERVLTKGLKWNLDGERPLEFGELISTSNQMVADVIEIETDAPLLWTTGLRCKELTSL